MPTYKEILEQLKAAGVVAQDGDFYDYEGFPLEREFETFFNFCQTYLDRDDNGISIKPARFYYNTNTDLNGLAYRTDAFSLVEIYKGAIFRLYDLYHPKASLFDQEPLNRYKGLIESKGISGPYFLFQYVTLYFLYHEVGHLIQRSDSEPAYLEYIKGAVLGNSIQERHMREHDADWFSAGQIVFHLLQFVEERQENGTKTIDVQELALVTELALAAMYTYFIIQAGGVLPVYYAAHSHPHPAVRACYMIRYMFDTMGTNIRSALSERDILTNAIRAAEALLQTPQANAVADFSRVILENIGQITEYIREIRRNSEAYPHLALKKLGGFIRR